jgi:ribose 1,5-bisphosphokinase PhnN
VGENISIRKSLDYTYHNNYIPERQHFQDRLIKNNVLLDGSGTAHPWLVFTCGPMGAGKGWVLGWMSANGILPLEGIAKVDPDAFKLRMPEWSTYQQHSMEAAGTQTHAESSYLAEIAQRLAMKNGMDVWVDGSLRHWEWYQTELPRIRSRFPQYRIAIVAIDAPEEMIETNIQRRAQETGRHIPEEL